MVLRLHWQMRLVSRKCSTEHALFIPRNFLRPRSKSGISSPHPAGRSTEISHPHIEVRKHAVQQKPNKTYRRPNVFTGPECVDQPKKRHGTLGPPSLHIKLILSSNVITATSALFDKYIILHSTQSCSPPQVDCNVGKMHTCHNTYR